MFCIFVDEIKMKTKISTKTHAKSGRKIKHRVWHVMPAFFRQLLMLFVPANHHHLLVLQCAVVYTAGLDFVDDSVLFCYLLVVWMIFTARRSYASAVLGSWESSFCPSVTRVLCD